MNLCKVGLVGCFVLILAGQTRTLSSAAEDQKLAKKRCEQKIEKVICIEEHEKVICIVSMQEMIVGTWTPQDGSGDWQFTGDGKILVFPAFTKSLIEGRYKIEGTKLTLTFDKDGTPSVTVAAINELTATRLVIVDSKGGRTELKRAD